MDCLNFTGQRASVSKSRKEIPPKEEEKRKKEIKTQKAGKLFGEADTRRNREQGDPSKQESRVQRRRNFGRARKAENVLVSDTCCLLLGRQTPQEPFLLTSPMAGGISSHAAYNYSHFLVITMLSLITWRSPLNASFLKRKVMPLFFI